MIDVSQLIALSADLRRASVEIESEAQGLVGRTGYAVHGDAMVNAPVDTGALRNSGEVDVDGLEFRVGFTVNYAGYVEHGTSRMAGQPYLGPAFERGVSALEGELDDLGVRVLRG